MNQIKIINPITYKGWDKLLLTNHQSTFFHTSAWARVLHESYRYRPLYFALIDSGKLSALMPIMEIKSFLTGKRGVSLPFTDECTLITKNPSLFNEIFKEIIRYGKKANWNAIDFKGGIKYLRGTTLPFETFLKHDLDLSKTEQEIFTTFRESTKRNIKKAIQKGVHVNIRNTIESIEEFYRLHCITRRSHGLPPQPFYFIKKIYEHIISKKKGFVVLATYRNKVIAGATFFQFGNQTIFKYGASDPRYLYLRPNNIVIWEAIKWHCLSGFKIFNFGRTELNNKGLLQFKRGWGTKEEILNYYKYDLKKDCFLNRAAGIKSSYNFFRFLPIPFLRLTGNLLYRHVG